MEFVTSDIYSLIRIKNMKVKRVRALSFGSKKQTHIAKAQSSACHPYYEISIGKCMVFESLLMEGRVKTGSGYRRTRVYIYRRIYVK